MKTIKVSDLMNLSDKPCEAAWPLIYRHGDREVNALDVLTAPELEGHDAWRMWIICHARLIDSATMWGLMDAFNEKVGYYRARVMSDSKDVTGLRRRIEYLIGALKGESK